jgi:hypothetical protein
MRLIITPPPPVGIAFDHANKIAMTDAKGACFQANKTNQIKADMAWQMEACKPPLLATTIASAQ